jgi:hypothetical protein
MGRVIKVGVTFEFYPDGEHEDLFDEDDDLEEIIRHCRAMAADDIDRLVKYNEVYEALSVTILPE